jgi:hypothetical protein
VTLFTAAAPIDISFQSVGVRLLTPSRAEPKRSVPRSVFSPS